MEENFEEKIRKAIEGEKNEYSSSIDALSKLLSKSWVKPSSEVSFEQIYEKAQSSKVLPFKRPLIYALSAAAAILLGAFGVFLLQNPKSSPAADQFTISVSKIVGKGYLSSSDSEKQLALNEGESVGRGQTLKTEAGSKLFLTVSKGEGMVLEEATELEILRDSKQSFRLKTGTVLVHLHKNLKKEDFRIYTSSGLVEVRGTKFEVRENKAEGTIVSVLEGRVAAINTNESDRGEQVLEPGQKIRLEPKGFHRSFLSSAEQRGLNLKFTELKVDEIPRNTERSFSDKEDLFKEYQRLERVVLSNGESLEGVIVDMDESFMYLQTLKNEIKIPRDSVNEVIQLR
ncbi:transcriptional regulator [Leptospira langatensis]|uniref:Transcriptional regulator n=1 Tax=Leptospira langatensis TaxID=2484983 RepID=A0A5F1ZQ82_9LEPT|nr:FecR family protein [Leptospira langatensis]TGK01931.1 transcriptional regulator [Leptospira langatensis]TGL39286.1 transcriptional regulator [Leptospira langatensis]